MKMNDLANKIMEGLIPKDKINERIVEIKFLFGSLPDPSNRIEKLEKLMLLDIGCCDSNILTDLSKLGFDMYGIDLRNYPRPIKNFVRCDARNIKFEDNTFDVCCAISTLEHIGLVETPYHTDKILDKDGDKKAVNEMLRVTKPGGTIIITLPYGTGHDRLNKWVRFYNKDRIEKLLPENLVVDNIRYSIRTGDKWVQTDEKAASVIPSHSTYVNSNICIAGYKI